MSESLRQFENQLLKRGTVPQEIQKSFSPTISQFELQQAGMSSFHIHTFFHLVILTPGCFFTLRHTVLHHKSLRTCLSGMISTHLKPEDPPCAPHRRPFLLLFDGLIGLARASNLSLPREIEKATVRLNELGSILYNKSKQTKVLPSQSFPVSVTNILSFLGLQSKPRLISLVLPLTCPVFMLHGGSLFITPPLMNAFN